MEEKKKEFQMDFNETYKNYKTEDCENIPGSKESKEESLVKTSNNLLNSCLEKEANLSSTNGIEQLVKNHPDNGVASVTSVIFDSQSISKSPEFSQPVVNSDSLVSQECDILSSINKGVVDQATSPTLINKNINSKDSSIIVDSKKNKDDALDLIQNSISKETKNTLETSNSEKENILENNTERRENCLNNFLDSTNNKISSSDFKIEEENVINNVMQNENEITAVNNFEEKIKPASTENSKENCIVEKENIINPILENEKSDSFLTVSNSVENIAEKAKPKSPLLGWKTLDLPHEKERNVSPVLEKDIETMNPFLNLKSSVAGEGEQNISEDNKLKKIENKENRLEPKTEFNHINNNSIRSISNKCHVTIDDSSEVVVQTNEKERNMINEKIFSPREIEKQLAPTIDINEGINSQNNLNTLSTNIEETKENFCRNENDDAGMHSEVFNCNEIEMIDLNENEFFKNKDNGKTESDLSEKKSNNTQKVERTVSDTLETSFREKVIDINVTLENNDKISPFDEKNVLPGNSEEETILGDTGENAEKDKDEDVCIVPDDLDPKLSANAHNKLNKTNSKKNDSKIFKKSDVKIPDDFFTIDSEKSKPKSSEKKEDEILKSRPLRSAAKLAGNKIRSLVLNESATDKLGSNENSKPGNMQNNSEDSHRLCAQCKEVKVWKFLMVHRDINQYLCSEQCSEAFTKNCENEADNSNTDNFLNEYVRKCAQCFAQVTLDEKCLIWETMDFCNENCLGKYQTKFGSNCANCKGNVFSNSMGKYCVRFGCDVKQFCSGTCLEEYKKGLKVCSYCQKDISTGIEGFLAPVGDKGQFKDFCTQSCMEKYEHMSTNTLAPDVKEECAVCSNFKSVRVEVDLDQKTHKLCSEPCFAAFKFVNNITEGQCDMCKKYFDRTKIKNLSIFYDEALRLFCSKTCMNVYILAHRKIIPCSWCKVKKYNFDMIKKGNSPGQVIMMCSLNCLTLHQLSVNTINAKHVKCDFCLTLAPPQYHLTMSDSTTRSFCTYTCVISFQNQYSKQSVDVIPGNEEQRSPIPTGLPKKVSSKWSQESPCIPIISSVHSLASSNGNSNSAQFQISKTDVVAQNGSGSHSLSMPTSLTTPPPQIYQQIITKPPPAKKMKNKAVLCKPYSHTKGVSCRPHPCLKETQTDQSLNRKFLIPIPVPIYVPCPMHMFATPFPVPVPFALPVPVPIFIPTTRNSAKGIMKEIKKIQEKIPTDPFEAELLMMAEMVAGEKKQELTDSESEDGNDGEDGGDGTFSPDNVDSSNAFGDDMLQMALKMASELDEPAVDMESVLTSNTITTQSQPPVDPNKALYNQVNVLSINRGRKRSVRGNRNGSGGTPSKRGKRTSSSMDVPLLPPPESAPPPQIEVEKPDADMCLKYTFGVNAWRHWVMQKNAELEKAALTNRKIKLFKPELLQLTADELNFSLCLFVKEVRKPNGTEYAPDTIYYLCLGIQQYLFENGRIDNIFTDTYYEKFTDCLDEVARKFASLFNDSQYIVTRVEEEHLWESKQLGAHSPHVLLSTLMFFNTKHFNLVTVEEHMQLSFSHIMKHWKRNPNTSGAAKVPSSRNVLLRFYPPLSALEANSRKKKVYEQQENEENPLRCPVKLYEFYLSKCPESVKTRNDVFYLLPERSCVPDSPVWYSTMALGKDPLMKMLHRVKMVKEINIALLSC